MSPLFASIAWGLVAYTMYGTAMVLMKVGSDALAHPRKALGDPHLRKRLFAWAIGVGFNFSFAAALGVALGLGHASVVSALNGFGLVVVAVLSRVFLKEILSSGQTAGMALVIVGVAFIGVLAAPVPDEKLMWTGRDLGLYLGAFGTASTVAVVVSKLLGWARGGAVLGGVAGVLGGAAIILQKIFVAPLFEQALSLDVILDVATSPWFWLWSFSATGSFVVLQVAYRFGEASTVAPLMVAFMILTPMAGGAWVFAEHLTGGQLLGTFLVLAGAMLLSALEPPPEAESHDDEGSEEEGDLRGHIRPKAR